MLRWGARGIIATVRMDVAHRSSSLMAGDGNALRNTILRCESPGRQGRPRGRAAENWNGIAAARTLSSSAAVDAASAGTASAASPGSSAGGGKDQANGDDKTKKSKESGDDSNIFLDNLGKIFLGSIGMVVAMLVRSSRATTNRNDLRADIETLSALDPIEIDDLRTANSELTPEVFTSIMDEVWRAFPEGTATYEEFVSVVVQAMRRLKGEAFTVELSHLLDRAVLSAIEDSEGGVSGMESSNMDGGVASVGALPLPFLFAALSLALNSTVRERVALLFRAMQGPQNREGQLAGDEASKTVPGEDVEAMVSHLQKTCQLVPDAQIVETDVKYPVQTYRVGTGADLVRKAREGGGKKGPPPATDTIEGPLDLDGFHSVLRSRLVCAWGECYVKKRSRIATSDKQ